MRKSFVAATVAAAALIGSASSADAAFQLVITPTSGPSVTITDGGAGDLSGAVPDGLIIFNGGVGGFTINTTVGSSNAPGTPTLAQLTINSLSISSAGFVGTQGLTFTLSDTNFMAPGAGQNASLVTQLSTTQLPTGTSVTGQSFIGANLGSLTGGTILNLNDVGGLKTSNTVTVPPNPFALENVTSVSVLGQGLGTELTVQVTGITAVAVPAPAGLILALTGLPVLGFGGWLRRRRTKA